MDSSGSGKYALLDQIAEEFAERRRRGEYPTWQEYARKYPDLAADLRDILPAMAELEQVKADDAVTAPPSPPAPVPRQVGDYRILREVGRGGMGVVYEAEQESLGRRVALKVLPAHALKDDKALERFKREARAAAKLHHTNIVPVFEVGRDGGACFYAMQFIQGQALDQIIDELRRLRDERDAEHLRAPSRAALSLLTGAYQPQDLTEGYAPAAGSPAEPPGGVSSAAVLSGVEAGHAHYFRSVAGIGQQVAQALAYAHARHIVHRDVKPSNLLLDAAGVVWVTDFGLAKTEDDGLTNTGDLVGTLRYMAPERFEGRGDARADVYALGLTLYELLTLQPAFAARDRLKLIEQIRTTEPPRPRSVDRRVPRDLETIVLKAMDKDAARRYQTAEELAQDLSRFLDDEPIHARQASVWERGWRWVRRRPAVAGLFAALTVAAVALIAVAVVLYYNRELDRLYQSAEKARGEADASRREAERARDNEIRLRGLLAVRTGQFRDAIDDLGKLLPSDDRDVNVGLGQAYTGMGQSQKAIEHFSAVLGRRPEDVEARVGRALEYEELRRYKEAADDYAAALRVKPNRAEFAGGYARALYEDAAWCDLEIIEMKSAGGAVLTRQPDGSILAREKNPDEDTYTITARCRLPRVSALRLEVMMPPADDARERRRYDRSPSWFLLGELSLRAAPAGRADASRAAAFELAWGTGVDGQVGSPANTIGGDPSSGWGGVITAAPPDASVALFVLREPLALPETDRLTVRLVFPRGNPRGHPGLSCFRLSAAARTDLIAFESLIANRDLNDWMKLAAAHCLCGDGAAAIRALAKANPKGANGFNGLLTALAQCQCERWQEGRETLLRAFPQTLPTSDVQALLAVALSQLLQHEPEDVELRLERARCYRRMEWWRPALADYERAQELDPKDALILLEGGECRLRLGDAGRAAADFEAARRIDPDKCYAFHVTRAPTQKDVSGRDLECGLVHLKALCQAARGDTENEPRLLWRLAELTARVTQYDDALAAYERILELRPRADGALMYAARVHRKRAETSALLGKQEEARQDWRRVRELLEKRLALEPDSSPYAGELARGLLAEGGRWTLVRPLEAKAERGGPPTLLPDGSVLPSGGKVRGDTYTLLADVDWKDVAGVRLEFMGHPRLRNGGPDSQDWLRAPAEIEIQLPRRWGAATASLVPPLDYPGWASDPDRAVFPMPSVPDAGAGKTSILVRPHKRDPGDVGRFRVAVTTDPQTILAHQVAEPSLDGWLRLALAYALRGDREAALTALKAMKSGPRDAFEQIMVAWVHLQAGSPEQARTDLRQALWSMRTSPFPQQSADAFAVTELVFAKALAAWPKDRELILQHAFFVLATGKEEAALDEFTKFLEQSAEPYPLFQRDPGHLELTVRVTTATPGGVTEANRKELLDLLPKARESTRPLLEAAVQVRSGQAKEAVVTYERHGALGALDLFLSALAYQQLERSANARKQLELANERMKELRKVMKEAQRGQVGKVEPPIPAEWAALLLLQREAEAAINGPKK